MGAEIKRRSYRREDKRNSWDWQRGKVFSKDKPFI
jgi:hypothetical protein